MKRSTLGCLLVAMIAIVSWGCNQPSGGGSDSNTTTTSTPAGDHDHGDHDHGDHDHGDHDKETT
ncbi:MAG: hypothetical protein GY768_01200 [Planctomycetaceae bacterium]|nr:hypothetical protein [Planctomycetaceae bacterium]